MELLEADLDAELACMVAKALWAFSVDASYGIAMVNTANLIERRREVWAARARIRRQPRTHGRRLSTEDEAFVVAELRRARREGLSLARCAKRAGVSTSTAHRRLRGLGGPRPMG